MACKRVGAILLWWVVWPATVRPLYVVFPVKAEGNRRHLPLMTMCCCLSLTLSSSLVRPSHLAGLGRRYCRWCHAASHTIRRAGISARVTKCRQHLPLGSVQEPRSDLVACLASRDTTSHNRRASGGVERWHGTCGLSLQHQRSTAGGCADRAIRVPQIPGATGFSHALETSQVVSVTYQGVAEAGGLGTSPLSRTVGRLPSPASTPTRCAQPQAINAQWQWWPHQAG
jgi:hypothetical protein